MHIFYSEQNYFRITINCIFSRKCYKIKILTVYKISDVCTIILYIQCTLQFSIKKFNCYTDTVHVYLIKINSTVFTKNKKCFVTKNEN